MNMRGKQLRAVIEQVDWALVILSVAFAAVTPMATMLGTEGPALVGITSRASNRDRAAYESSIAAAAVKRPKYAVKLETIDPSTTMVDVVNFGTRQPQDKNRSYDVWVALPSQLKSACAGAADPVRRLQQILGLPPATAEDAMITELRVSRDALFRPCVGGGDLAASKCSTDVPGSLPATADATAVREGYDRMQFFTAQIWKSYRSGFGSSDGYPFTGMGWTYDWSNVPDHIGVSEFVVKRDATIAITGTKTPAEFCTAAAK
jgi:hypothetical protein